MNLSRRFGRVWLYFAMTGVAISLPRRGEASTELFYPGAQYPSVAKALINPPYFIMWYGVTADDPSLYANTVIESHDWGFRDHYDAWKALPALKNTLFLLRRMAKKSAGIEGSLGPYGCYDGHSACGYLEYFRTAAQRGFEGISIDEYLYRTGDDLTRFGYLETTAPLRQVKKEFPSFLIAAWSTMADNPLQWFKDSVDAWDILMTEFYINEKCGVFPVEQVKCGADGLAQMESRLNSLVAKGFPLKTAIGLNLGHSDPNIGLMHPSAAFFEEQIKLIRKIDPQSPGLAFFKPLQGPNDTAFVKIIKQYYFDPAPSAQITSLSDGQTVGGTVPVTVHGTPNPSTKKPIASYRFFIDNECVYVGNASSYAWDANDWPEGTHVVTAHAVDSTFLVGVEQIEVTVDHAVTTTGRAGLSMRAAPLRLRSKVDVFALRGRKIASTSAGGFGAAACLPAGVYVVAREGRVIGRREHVFASK